jgi:Glycine rich protein
MSALSPMPRSRLAFGRRLVLASTLVALVSLALPASAAAGTVSFQYTGASQAWTVPTGVTQATFDVFGAAGGGFTDFPFVRGLGGHATATLAVTPGDVIHINVGGEGTTAAGQLNPPGGFNGGGDGGLGSGGGGASDIRIGGTDLSDRVLVAGGGGGAARSSVLSTSSHGGDGGGTTGLPGGAGAPAGAGGGGGTQAAGGSAVAPATPGELGAGGTGNVGNFGGGGGGGLFGGGGGNTGGGGGGSGLGPAGTAFETGVRAGNGLVIVTFETTAIGDLMDSVVALDLGTGVQKGLLKPLIVAQQRFDAGQTGTCDALTTFIAQVDKKAPRKIAQADADALIEEASGLLGSFACG